ncbi:sporulation protein [Saccharothrix yanglingensis]|uniref:Sporulation protein n=1 Tax=Saccharothrix yanglingensis TaxID=659496 RepID=A0ABU0XBH3_9PSEU|nr:sporulation protein [Saccharothrix yanglingensis]MDQ2588599.1 sporulation protein [Saccharothrix yanglingensis]
MLRAFGVGGPTVDTVLANPNVRPGELLTGEVRIMGGDHPADIDEVKLSLVTRVEVESGDNEHNRTVEFARLVVGRRVAVGPGQNLVLPFRFPVPLETPLTVVHGQPLHGMTMGLRTELEVRGAVDPGDLDPVAVHPVHSQEHVLNAFGALGFRFQRADNEQGRIHGVPQQLPFYQEIEFLPPQQFLSRISQLELTFVTDPHHLYTVLEADRRGGLFRQGGDSFGHFAMTHDEVVRTDWAALVHQWMEQVAGRRSSGGHGMHGGHHGGHHGRGMGAGGLVAGAAAGVFGGMILGEALDEVGDFFEGE